MQLSSVAFYLALCAVLAPCFGWAPCWPGMRGAVEGRRLLQQQGGPALGCAAICFIGRDASQTAPYWQDFWIRRGIKFDAGQDCCVQSCAPLDLSAAVEYGAVSCAQYCSEERVGTATWGTVFCPANNERWEIDCPQMQCQATCLSYFRTGSVPARSDTF